MRIEAELSHKEQKKHIDLRGGGLNEDSKKCFSGGGGNSCVFLYVSAYYSMDLDNRRVR